MNFGILSLTILNILDEPVADPSIIPLYHLTKLASQHVKVVLSGEGADELFGGYNIYQNPPDPSPNENNSFLSS